MARKNDESLLDQLYVISGRVDRQLSDAEFRLIACALVHEDDSVRERAIFIGGLRSVDPVFIGFFLSSLLLGSERSDENRRLMIESLVSASLNSPAGPGKMIRNLKDILDGADPSSLEAKSAFVGIKRLRGEISTGEFAILDYDDIHVA